MRDQSGRVSILQLEPRIVKTVWPHFLMADDLQYLFDTNALQWYGLPDHAEMDRVL